MRKNTLGFTVFILVFSGFLNLGYACKYLKHTSEDSFLKKELAFLNFLDGGLNKEKFSFYLDTVSSIDVDSGNSLWLDEDDCSVTTLPYSENFNTYGTGSDAFPNCWERPVTYTSGSVWPSIVSAYSVSSPNSLRFQSEVGIPTYAISPAFAEDLHNLRVRFQLKREGTSSGTMDIGVMSDPLDTATFELVETIDPADNNFHEYVFNLNETTLSGGDNYIAVRHNSNANNWYYWLDDFMVELIPSCLEPDALTVTAPTTTGATLGWASNGDLFDIEIVEAGEDPTGTPTESGVSNPHTATDLSVSTSYEFYVRRDCGDGDLSVWVGPFAFATACDVITDLPYTENFDTYGTGSDAFPNCWERPVVYSGYPSIVSTYSVSSPNSLRFQSEVGIPTYAVSPAFAEDLHNLRVRFQLKREGTSSGTMDIGVMSDPLDTATFELVETINPADNNFHEYVFNLNETTLSGGDNYIAVRHNSNANNWYYWLDKFVVELLPSCLEPDALTVTAPTTTGATLGWASNGDLFDIEIVEAGEDPTGTPTESGVSNPYIATALDSSTIYEYYVRQDCGDGDLSVWVGPFAFATACEVITDLPYSENFDTYGTGSDAFPDCWERPVMYSGYPSIVSVNSVSSPNSLRFQSLVGTPTYAVSPAFAEDLHNLRVRFQLKREGTSSGTMDIGVMSDPLDITTFELVGTINPADNDYHEYVFNLDQTTLSGGDNYIAVRQNSTSSAWYYWMDNFVVELLPSCVEPGSLTVDDITTTGATLGWASNGDLFDIEIVGAGEEPTGTPTEAGVANPYTATELSASTTYEYYVRQDCGDGDLSEWSGPFAFATACDVITDLPYTENFDIYGTGSDAFPNCWERPVMYSGYPSIVSAYSVSSPNSLRFQSLVGTPTYAVSPAFAEDLHNLRVRFQLKREGTSSGTMDVGVMSDPLDITTFELVGTINPTDNDFHEYVFNLNETTLSGGGNYIAVRQNSDSSAWYYWMDNFVVELLPACLEPSGVTITHTSEDSVTVSWTAPQEQDTWQVLVLPAGSPAPDENTTGFVETNDNPYIAEGLEPNTEYDIYVRADCGNEDGLSTWTGPAKGTTTQIPAELPYDEGFEGENNWSFVGTGDNQWVFGTAVNNGGTHALYVSKDEGTTHTYNTSSTTVAHAYRDFLVEDVSGELEISFDWMANGEGTSTKWDYLNVWLVPSSYNPTPGTLIENTVNNGMLLMYKRNNNTEFLPEFLSIDINTLNAAFDSGYFRIVFEWRNDSGGGDQPPAAIDNLLIKKVTCPPVINLESDIAENGEAGEAQVLLSWTPVGDETQWEIIILPFDDPTVPDENSTGIIVDEPQYLFTVEDDNPGEILCDNKFYKFYVRPLCSEEDWGRWSKQGIVSLIPPPGCAEVEAEIVFSDVEGLTPNAKGDYVICQDEPVNLTLSATYYDIPGTETYEIEAIEYCPPFPFTGGDAVELTVDDRWSEIIDLGFDFCYFGNSYNKALISTNGAISFSIAGVVEGGRYSPDTFAPYNPVEPIPTDQGTSISAGPTVNSVLGVFQDSDPSRSPEDYSINYQIMGKAPCRTLVFNVYNLGMFSCGYDENDIEGTTQTSQIVLYEGTNIIEVYVKNRNPYCSSWGGRGVIGIQNENGTIAYAPPGRNTGDWYASEEAWRFSPSGESTAEFSWEKDGEFFSSEPEIEISVNESAKYVARAKYELCGEEFNLTKTFNFLKENFVIGPVEDLIDCSRKPGELNEFDLSSNTALALGDFDADDYTIEYFGSEEDAESGENPLPDVYQRQGGQTIYIKMTNKTTGCYKTKTIKLIKAEPINITQSANLSVCESYTFPVIEPGEAFYTQPYGEGDKYETGDVFSDIGVHKFYIYRVDEHGCFGQSEFELEIVEAPVADIIPDMVLECETFTLPTPSAYNKYYTLADKGGTEIPAGTEIILPSTIYIYAERKGDDGAVCIDQSSFTIDYKDCPLPRGFSPNGDGLNDFYDLDGYGVSSIKIFNRNGVEVYTQGVYKGEWYGQDKSGKALPSGTYYYVIVSNGKTRTGWIQLNR